jgi:hypothetical protein
VSHILVGSLIWVRASLKFEQVVSNEAGALSNGVGCVSYLDNVSHMGACVSQI